MSQMNEPRPEFEAEPMREGGGLTEMGREAVPDVMAEPGGAISGPMMMAGTPLPQAAVMSDPAPGGEEGEGPGEYPEMEPRSGEVPEGPFVSGVDARSFGVAEQGEGYLRLVVSVEGGEMKVIDASVVGGPLIEQPDLTGQMAYEAILAGRRIAAEAFTDLALQSSFAPPDDEERGHGFSEAAQFDFVVRIPRGEVTVEQLSDLEIELVRPGKTTELSQDRNVRPGVTFAAAAAEAGADAPEVVARLSGVRIEDLPERAANAVRSGLRSRG